MQIANNINKTIVGFLLLITFIVFSDTSSTSQSSYFNQIELLAKKETPNDNTFIYENGIISSFQKTPSNVNKYSAFNSVYYLAKINLDINILFKSQKEIELDFTSKKIFKKFLLLKN